MSDPKPCGFIPKWMRDDSLDEPDFPQIGPPGDVLTDAGVETMLAVARDKNAPSGRYKRQPRKVPTVAENLAAVREFQEEWDMTPQQAAAVDAAFSVKNRPTIEAKSLPEKP